MRTWLVALALVAAAGVAGADGDPDLPGTEPVPTELLRGRTLVLESLNCQIDGPGGFTWLVGPPVAQHPELHTFICRDKEQNHVFQLEVFDIGGGKLDEAGAEDFLKGFCKSREADWDITPTPIKPATLGANEAFRVFLKIVRKKNKQGLTWVGYVAKAQRFYLVSSLQAEEQELAEFNAFARSFKLLHAVPPDEAPSSGSFMGRVILGATVSLFVVLLMQWLQRRAARKGTEAKAEEEPEDEDDETDAFKPKPVKDPFQSKKKPEPIEPQSKGRTRRDAPRPEKPRPDEDSRPRKPKAR
jgi:hypothetical protein